MATMNTGAAIEQAQKVLEYRMDAVRDLAGAQQHLADVNTRADEKRKALEAELAEVITEAKSEASKAFERAIKAGWSTAELKRVGFTEPARRTLRRRTKAKSAPRETSPVEGATDGSER